MNENLLPQNNDATSPHELRHLCQQWRWFLALGIGLVVIGILAAAASYAAGLLTVVLFGLLLLMGGIAQVVSSFWAGRWSGFLLHLLVGLLYTVTGMLIIDAPDNALDALTLLIAAVFILVGIFRIVGALSIQFHDWGWVVLNGAVSLLLGLLIYRHWPASGEWVLGLFIGIELIFTGWFWIMVGIGL
ncbi:MAG: DUF308 domain-containing protein, partial [Planctomycetes bacterium]|nr:DUF308 domain-containing protein [Planctomycetota bacterium]